MPGNLPPLPACALCAGANTAFISALLVGALIAGLHWKRREYWTCLWELLGVCSPRGYSLGGLGVVMLAGAGALAAFGKLSPAMCLAAPSATLGLLGLRESGCALAAVVWAASSLFLLAAVAAIPKVYAVGTKSAAGILCGLLYLSGSFVWLGHSVHACVMQARRLAEGVAQGYAGFLEFVPITPYTYVERADFLMQRACLRVDQIAAQRRPAPAVQGGETPFFSGLNRLLNKLLTTTTDYAAALGACRRPARTRLPRLSEYLGDLRFSLSPRCSFDWLQRVQPEAVALSHPEFASLGLCGCEAAAEAITRYYRAAQQLQATLSLDAISAHTGVSAFAPT